MKRIINSTFRDGRLALGDELVNISGKRFGPITFFTTNSERLLMPWISKIPNFEQVARAVFNVKHEIKMIQ